MGVEIAKAYLSIRADASALPNDFQSIKQQATTQLAGLATTAAGLLTPIALMGRAIIASGVAAAGSFEQTKVEMETLIGSAEETEKTLDSLTKFAAETPFEMPQLLDVSRQLLTFGERGDGMMDTLKMLGDASMGSAEKFGLLGTVFNQIRGEGHLLTQDFRQLSTRGIISLQDISKHFGVSDAAASKMLSTGKISFAAFRDILSGLTSEGGRFADGMLKQSTTLVGLRSTFNDAIGITQRFIAQPLLPYLKGALSGGLIPMVSTLGNLVKTGGEAVSFAVVGATAFAGLAAGLTAAGFAARFFGTSLTKALLVGLPVAGTVLAIGAGLGYLASYFQVPQMIGDGFSWLGKKATEAWAYLSKSTGIFENLEAAWRNVSRAVTIAFDAVMGAMAPLFNTAGGWLAGLTTAVSETITGSLILFSDFAVEISEWVRAIAENWQALWRKWPFLVAFGLSYSNNIVWNAANKMLDAFKWMAAKVIDTFVGMAKAIGGIFLKLQGTLARYMPTWKQEMTPLNVDGMANAAKRGLGLDKGSGVKSIFEMSGGTRAILNGSKLGAVFDKITRRKTELENSRDAKKFGPERPPDEKPKTPGPLPADSPMMKAGVYEINAFGKKLQESALSKVDTGAQQVALLEQGNKLQEKQLKATEDLKGAGGLANDE